MRLFPRKRRQGPKTWAVSQEYEFSASRQWMGGEPFGRYLGSLRSDRADLLKSLDDYFFRGDKEEFTAIARHAKDKNNLEIGPSCAPLIYAFEPTRPPHIIEPLGDKIADFQMQQFGFSVFSASELHSVDAADPLPELKGAIDGIIYVRNCIDHSPKWPFIMANIALFAAPGCRLLFWSEMSHGLEPDEGHYNITDRPEDFLALTEALGFRVDRHFSDNPSLPDLGLIATKL